MQPCGSEAIWRRRLLLGCRAAPSVILAHATAPAKHVTSRSSLLHAHCTFFLCSAASSMLRYRGGQRDAVWAGDMSSRPTSVSRLRRWLSEACRRGFRIVDLRAHMAVPAAQPWLVAMRVRPFEFCRPAYRSQCHWLFAAQGMWSRGCAATRRDCRGAHRTVMDSEDDQLAAYRMLRRTPLGPSEREGMRGCLLLCRSDDADASLVWAGCEYPTSGWVLHRWAACVRQRCLLPERSLGLSRGRVAHAAQATRLACPLARRASAMRARAERSSAGGRVRTSGLRLRLKPHQLHPWRSEVYDAVCDVPLRLGSPRPASARWVSWLQRLAGQRATPVRQLCRPQ